jgi:hypothetical protein
MQSIFLTFEKVVKSSYLWETDFCQTLNQLGHKSSASEVYFIHPGANVTDTYFDDFPHFSAQAKWQFKKTDAMQSFLKKKYRYIFGFRKVPNFWRKKLENGHIQTLAPCEINFWGGREIDLGPML